MENRLNSICNQFQLEGTILTVKPLGEGFINDTLMITTAEATAPNYILQRKNKNIFQYIFLFKVIVYDRNYLHLAKGKTRIFEYGKVVYSVIKYINFSNS